MHQRNSCSGAYQEAVENQHAQLPSRRKEDINILLKQHWKKPFVSLTELKCLLPNKREKKHTHWLAASHFLGLKISFVHCSYTNYIVTQTKGQHRPWRSMPKPTQLHLQYQTAFPHQLKKQRYFYLEDSISLTWPKIITKLDLKNEVFRVSYEVIFKTFWAYLLDSYLERRNTAFLP
jgi:hypothetical protein